MWRMNKRKKEGGREGGKKSWRGGERGGEGREKEGKEGRIGYDNIPPFLAK